MAATAPTPLSRGGLGGVLRPRDLVRAVTLLKKLFSWRGSQEIETWRWIARKASRQEQSPRGADANPATWDAKSLSERNSNLKVAGSIFHQQGRDVGDSRVTPCVTSLISRYVLGWPLAYTMFVLLGNGKTWSKRCKMWPRTLSNRKIKQIVIVTEQKTHPWFLQRQGKKKKEEKETKKVMIYKFARCQGGLQTPDSTVCTHIVSLYCWVRRLLMELVPLVHCF